MLKHDRSGRHHVVVATVPAGQAAQVKAAAIPLAGGRAEQS